MKLRNKKTGEIIEVESLYLTQSQELQLTFTDEKNERKLYMTDKISTFENEWEDYEEPKKMWFISNNGQIHNDEGHERFREERKQIGNYFETEEQAEKAVEKLKAWKRLKDAGFKVISYGDNDIEYEIKHRYNNCIYDLELLLFGGEE